MPATPEGAAGAETAGDTDQLLLFAVQLDNATLTEALATYGDPADPLIPIGELSRLLDLDLDIQPATGLISGSIGESRRAITIDLRSGLAVIGTRTISLVPPEAKVTPSDIYLRASLVEKLLPLTIRASPDDLVLSMTATEKLPLQARGERASRMAGLSGMPDHQDDVLQIATPYRWAGLPAFDFGIELGGDSSRHRPTTRFEGRVAADLLQTDVTGYVATDENGSFSTARLKAERRSAEGDMLGPLHATYAALGDVYTPSLVLGPRSSGGAGVVLSTTRIEETSIFQRIDLRGELPIGYDIELYVNDILTSGNQGGSTAGRYEFANVPLVRGRNILKVVLYGPRGERSEQTRVINVGGGQLAAGQTVLNAGLVAQDRPVLDLSNDDRLPGNRSRGSLRAVLEVAQGLTPALTVSAGLALYQDYSGQSHQVLTGGLRTSLLGLAVQGDVARDFKGGSAASLGAAGRVGGVSFVARHAEYSGPFADEVNIAWDMGRPLVRYSELNLDMSLRLPGQGRLPLSGRIDRAEYADGGTVFSARGRTTVSIADTIVGVGADYRRKTGATGNDTQFTGTLSAARFVDYKWQLRASADYEFKPNFSLRSLGFTADRAIADRYSVRLGATRNFSSHDLSLQAGLSAHLPFAEATLGGDWSPSQKRWRFGLQLNFGLAFDPLGGGYRLTPPGPATGGSAAMLAFVDDNGNGHRDADEDAVPGVTLQGGARHVTTDAEGRAFVTGLGDGPSAMLRADTSNTDTVFVTSPPQNIAFAPRPGTVVEVLYPMVPTSELVLRLRFRQQDGALTGLSAVRVRLVAASGEIVQGQTEFDGTAVFDALKPGSYNLELDPDQARKLAMQLIAPIRLTVTGDGRTLSAESEIAFIRKPLP